MIRLTKYLKPYIFPIVLTIVLLFVQANADLALPDYLSRIVNNGIQQGGVESAVPQAIRQSEMDRLTLFMDADGKELVLDDYSLVEQGSPGYDAYLAQYSTLADEPVYVLDVIDQAETDRLRAIMGKALVVVSGIEQAIADPSKAAMLARASTYPGFLPVWMSSPCWDSSPQSSGRR